MNDESEYPTEADLKEEEERIIDEYTDRYKSRVYEPVFDQSSQFGTEAWFPDGYFESARELLEEVVIGGLPTGVYGVPAVFLSRHYLELALKYLLYHSRWLKTETTNATDGEIEAVRKGHQLKPLWDLLRSELKSRAPSNLRSGLDLDFVGKFVDEFHAVDQGGTLFRYDGGQIPALDRPLQKLGTNYGTLLFNLRRVHDILSTLDTALIEQHGENEEWEQEMNSW